MEELQKDPEYMIRRRIAETDCEDYEENESSGGRTEFRVGGIAS